MCQQAHRKSMQVMGVCGEIRSRLGGGGVAGAVVVGVLLLFL